MVCISTRFGEKYTQVHTSMNQYRQIIENSSVSYYASSGIPIIPHDLDFHGIHQVYTRYMTMHVLRLGYILGHWPWRLLFSWRVTWKSDCFHFQEAWSSSINLLILELLSLLSLQGRWPGERRAASLSAFCDWIGEFLKWHPWQMAATWVLIEI
jgi:hypothetical protein